MAALATAHSAHAGKKDKSEYEIAKEICEGKKRVRDSSEKSRACHEVGRMDALSAPCSTIVEAYRKSSSGGDRSYVATMAGRLGDCDRYDAVFEKIAHWGNKGEGRDILIEMEESGRPMVQKYREYLTTHQGARFFALDTELIVSYGMRHINQWLLTKGHDDLCVPMVQAADGASNEARYMVAGYVAKYPCEEGKALLVSLLQSDQPHHRQWTCETLGKTGTLEVVPAVTIVAQTDGHYEVKETLGDGGRVYGVKEYPVRDACTQALGQIELRMASQP